MSFDPRVIKVENQAQLIDELNKIKADKDGISLMAPKGQFFLIKLRDVPVPQANIIKQEMLAKGGEAAVARGVAVFSIERTDILLMGTLKQYRQLINKLRMQPWGLKKLAEELKELLQKQIEPGKGMLNCGEHNLDLGQRTYIMGILNITPDSFSDGGKYIDVDSALRQAVQMVEDGADIIDIGGESTRPQATPISIDEEMYRVMPIIERLAKEIPVPISIDTYKGQVAREAVKFGASLINDVWGLRYDDEMVKAVAESHVPYIMMHNQTGTEYTDLLGDIIKFFKQGIEILREKDVNLNRLIIDPGIGFGKTHEQNIEVMKRLEELNTLGLPMLLGTSRKSIIGNTLGLPVEERLEGTAATVSYGIIQGASIIRVHDVKQMARVAKMTDALVRGN